MLVWTRPRCSRPRASRPLVAGQDSSQTYYRSGVSVADGLTWRLNADCPNGSAGQDLSLTCTVAALRPEPLMVAAGAGFKPYVEPPSLAETP